MVGKVYNIYVCLKTKPLLKKLYRRKKFKKYMNLLKKYVKATK